MQKIVNATIKAKAKHKAWTFKAEIKAKDEAVGPETTKIWHRDASGSMIGLALRTTSVNRSIGRRHSGSMIGLALRTTSVV